MDTLFSYQVMRICANALEFQGTVVRQDIDFQSMFYEFVDYLSDDSIDAVVVWFIPLRRLEIHTSFDPLLAIDRIAELHISLDCGHTLPLVPYRGLVFITPMMLQYCFEEHRAAAVINEWL